MPVALDPERTFFVVLDTDKEKPADTQPRFICRFLTTRKWREVAGAVDAVSETPNQTSEAVFDSLIGAAETVLCGWENMIGPDGKVIRYDPGKIEDVLNPAEISELVYKALKGADLDADEKKRSGLPLQAGTGNSARGRVRKRAKRAAKPRQK